MEAAIIGGAPPKTPHAPTIMERLGGTSELLDVSSAALESVVSKIGCVVPAPSENTAQPDDTLEGRVSRLENVAAEIQRRASAINEAL